MLDFYARQGVVANVTAQLVAPAASVECTLGETAAEIQSGTSRRFESVNGFAIGNGYLEDTDDDGAALGFGCALPTGRIGTTTQCDGGDPVLASFFGPSPPTMVESAVYQLDFDVLAATELVLDWSFATFEDPTNAVFFDTFGIVYDDGTTATLLAGGTTNGGPLPGSVDQGWSLSPSTLGEFQSQNFPGGLHEIPAYETGRRRLALALSPGAGHRLSFHVADSGPTIPSPPLCNPGEDGADPQVHSMLFCGRTSYRAADGTGTTPGVTLDTVGHPGSPVFTGDLSFVVEGLAPSSLVLLAVSRDDLLPVSVPVIAPWDLLVDLPLFETLSEVADGTGRAQFDFPFDLSLVTGDFFAQAWGIGPLPGALVASPGYRALF